MAGTAAPESVGQTGNVWLDGILWGTAWRSADAGPAGISFYIAGLAGTETVALRDHQVTSISPLYTEEVRSIRRALGAVEAVCGVQFHDAASQADADIVYASVGDADAGGGLGWANPPGTEYLADGSEAQSLIAINWTAYSPGPSDGDMLVAGGLDYVTFVHELGHALGLAHPHDTGGGSTVFPGVTAAFGDYGDFAMNQGVFTMMSYNDGWRTGPPGASPENTYGYEIGPMALDIAALQYLYGANENYRAGDDVYALPTANAAGTGYLCIWDAGGRDRIAGGDLGNVIDLREASLLAAAGGGGWVSSASGIHGGFTIAHGVTIEDALGGAGADVLRGNAAGNVLAGARGADALFGGEGGDRLRGGGGGDRLDGGLGADLLRGGRGADVFVFSSLADSGGRQGNDRIADFERGVDQLDLSAFDANADAAGQQSFAFDTGGAFAAGEIRQIAGNGGIILAFNAGDGRRAELTIAIDGPEPLTIQDFIL